MLRASLPNKQENVLTLLPVSRPGLAASKSNNASTPALISQTRETNFPMSGRPCRPQTARLTCRRPVWRAPHDGGFAGPRRAGVLQGPGDERGLIRLELIEPGTGRMRGRSLTWARFPVRHATVTCAVSARTRHLEHLDAALYTVHPVAMHTHRPHEMGVSDAGQDSWRGRGWCATEWRVGIAPGPNVISRAGPSISPGRSFGHICTDGRYVYMYVTGHVRPIAPFRPRPGCAPVTNRSRSSAPDLAPDLPLETSSRRQRKLPIYLLDAGGVLPNPPIGTAARMRCLLRPSPSTVTNESPSTI